MALTPLPTLFFLALAAIATTGCNANVSFGDTTRRIEHKTITVEGVPVIDVSTDNGRVDIVGADVDDVEVEVILRESREGDADYTIETRGNTVEIVGECDSGLFRRCSVEFVVTVPHASAATVFTDNGQIVLDGLSGPIDVRTDNGAITGDGLTAHEVSVVTDNGRIRLVFDDAPTAVTALTDNGAIDVLLPDTSYDVDASSDNGAVHVDVDDDPESERTIVARSDNGRVEVEPRR